MKARNRTLIALAVGAALASPVALSQDQGQTAQGQTAEAQATQGQTVQGQAATKINADIPNPAATAQQTTDRAVDTAQDRVGAAAQTAQDASQSVPTAPPQSQGAVNADAHAAVTRRALWDRLDADRDGSISTAEAEADAEFGAGFARIDSDADGMVSDAEYTAYAKTEPVPGSAHAAPHAPVAMDGLWRQYDADADGRLSAAEVKADADIGGSFSAIDDDSDGYLTQAEYRAYAQANSKPEPATP
jgi:Ca2+-binding EF-hand superfamily protein